MDIYEAIENLRSMRRLKPDPVPDELIRKVLGAAIRAASGGNQQTWAFLVVKDPQKKLKIAGWYQEGLERLFASGYGQSRPGEPSPTAEQTAASERTRSSARHLAEHMGEVPVLIFACLIGAPGSAHGPRSGASIYPAVQNLMLAACAEGLGTTLTTIHDYHDQELKALLGIPEHVLTAAMVPMGWPTGKFGPGPRKPLEEVTYAETWGQRPAW